MRLALCQRTPESNSVVRNLETVLSDVEGIEADVYVYPEMFLTGYFYDPIAVHDDLMTSKERLREISAEKDVAIVIGAPDVTDDGTYNCAYAFVSGNVTAYRKIHLPNFPPFDEKERFSHGSEPTTFQHKGYVFGLSICYDVFFPELMKHCTIHAGADVNLCISASPVTSRTAFERVLPARAVENTTYVAYVNNIGRMGDLEFFGGSRLLAPNGDTLTTVDGSGIVTFEIDKSTIKNARKMRPVIEDSLL